MDLDVEVELIELDGEVDLMNLMILDACCDLILNVTCICM